MQEETNTKTEEMIINVLDKLREIESMIPLTKEQILEIDKYYYKMLNLASDIRKIAKIQIDDVETFSLLEIKLNLDGSASVYTPNAHIYLDDLSGDCLKSKVIFKCLAEKFENKQAYYDKLTLELVETLEKFISKIRNNLPDLRRVEWMERDIYTLRDIVNNIASNLRKSEEKEEEEEQEE